MSRSLKKGPFVSESLIRKVNDSNLKNICGDYILKIINVNFTLMLFTF
jgi:ribosomal protein S19